MNTPTRVLGVTGLHLGQGVFSGELARCLPGAGRIQVVSADDILSLPSDTTPETGAAADSAPLYEFLKRVRWESLSVPSSPAARAARAPLKQTIDRPHLLLVETRSFHLDPENQDPTALLDALVHVDRKSQLRSSPAQTPDPDIDLMRALADLVLTQDGPALRITRSRL